MEQPRGGYGFIPWFKSYWTERGKNLATKEDIRNLLIIAQQEAEAKKKGEIEAVQKDLQLVLHQLRETTALTKQIEADISHKVWDRQMRLSFKRDLYVRLLESLGEKIRTLNNLIRLEARVKKHRELCDVNDQLTKTIQSGAALGGIALPGEVTGILDSLSQKMQWLVSFRQSCVAASGSRYF